MRVLVCGSRTLEDEWAIHRVLDGIFDYEHSANDRLVVIEGGGRGADAHAASWVAGFGPEYPTVAHEQYPADWTLHGKGAGPIRNELMLRDGKPDVVWAFVDKPLQHSKGTADMVRRARNAQVPTYVVEVMPTRG
jgi:hypothetical protein